MDTVTKPVSDAVCPHEVSEADNETEPVSVLRCLGCGEPIGTYYPNLPVDPVSLATHQEA